MDTNKSLYQLLIKKRRLPAVFAALAALGAALLIASLFFRTTPLFKQAALTPETGGGRLCSLEIEAITPSFVRDEQAVYCAAVGADGYYYIVAMTPEEFSTRFEALCLFTLYPDSCDAVPPVSLVGTTALIPNELISHGADYWCSGDERQFLADFGEVYLSAVKTPVYLSTALLLGGIAALLAGAAVLFSFLQSNLNALACLPMLKNEPVAEQLGEPVFKAGSCVFTKDYLVDIESGVALKLCDVVWAYRLVAQDSMTLREQSLCVHTRRRSFTLLQCEPSGKSGVIDDALDYFRKNTSALVDYSAENEKRYKAARR